LNHEFPLKKNEASKSVSRHLANAGDFRSNRTLNLVKWERAHCEKSLSIDPREKTLLIRSNYKEAGALLSIKASEREADEGRKVR
jgi:hypothetical protein